MAELGVGHISIVASTDGMTRDIKKALGGLDAPATQAGTSMGDKLVGGIGKTLKVGVIGAGVAAGGALAGALTKGLGRLQGIDNAKAKLAGLGHEAGAVSGIMDDALASVKGTAFGLEDAATIAASAVAAGIGPGEDLQRTLKLTADAATIAGTDLSSMGSIINKVATSDMMQLDVANQLMDAGIPILQMVGEELGVTAEEARKMASAGEISFETFQNALDDGLGGAALKSGETVQGAFDNMGAAAGRFGAKLLEPVFSSAPEVFGAIGGAFDTLGEKLEPVITAVGEWLAPKLEDFAENTIPKMVDGLISGVDALIDFGGWVQDNSEWIAPLAAAVGAAAGAWMTWTVAIKAWQGITKIATGIQAAFNAVMAANPIMLAVMAIAALVAGLTYFFTQTETGQRIWEQFTTALSDGWDWVVEKVTAGWTWLKENFFISWDEAVAGIKDSWTYTVDTITGWWDTLTGALSAGWETIKTTVFDAWNNAVAFIQASWNLATNALAFAWAWVKDQFTAVWNTIKTAVFDAWTTYVNNVKSNWDTVTGALSTAWTALKDGLVNTWTTIKTNVFTAFENTMTAFKGFFETIVDGIGTTWNKLRSLLAKPINFMITTVYNDGILRAWNIIADILPGLKTGSPLAGIPEHATGGRIVGPGTGTSDDVLMWGSNGEHMMTALEVKRLGGHGHVYSMREAIRTGRPFVSDGMGGIVVLPQRMNNRAGDLAGAAPEYMLPAFRDGGEIQPLWKQQLAAAHKFAQAQHGKPYQWAGPTGPGSSFDCSGFMGSIAATIQNTNPWQRYWATMSFANGNTAQGFVPGLGPGFSIGLFNGGPYGGHTAGTLGAVGPHPTVNVESGGSPSMVKYGVGAVGADHGSFTHRYHLPIGADGAFVSGGSGFDFLGSVKKWITDKVSGILDPIKALLPSGPPAWEDIPKSIFDAGTGAFRGFVEDKIANLGHLVSGVWGRITDLFDNGGVLEHGRMAVNRSGRPEIILTNAQWRIFGKAVQALAPATEALNDAAQGFHDWARATEEQDRMGYPHEWAAHFGSQAATAFADDALSLVGLGGIAGGRLKPSLVNLLNVGADNLNDVYGTRFGHVREDTFAPVSLLDAEGRAVGTRLERLEEQVADIPARSPETVAPDPAVKPVSEVVVQVDGDAVSVDTMNTALGRLEKEIGGVKIRVEKLENAQTASVVAGVAGIV